MLGGILFVGVTHIGIFLGPYDVHPEVTTYVDVPILPRLKNCRKKKCASVVLIWGIYILYYIVLYKCFFNLWAKIGDIAASDRQTEHTSVSAARVYPIKGYFSYIGGCL
jgi:hypothetical protein